MDTSDSEAFESADENFETDQSLNKNPKNLIIESDDSDPDSNVHVSTTINNTQVFSSNQIDDISNLLDNLQVKFDHCRTVEEDDDTSTTSVCEHNDDNRQNISAKSKISSSKSSDVENLNIAAVKQSETVQESGWDDLENLNIESSTTENSTKNVVSSGWDDDDLENLNINKEEEITTIENPLKFVAPEDVESSGWDDEDLDSLNQEKLPLPENPTKCSAASEDGKSDWDDEDLESINQEKLPLPENLAKCSKVSEDGKSDWDDEDLESVNQEKLPLPENPAKCSKVSEKSVKCVASEEACDEEDLEQSPIIATLKTVDNPTKFAALVEDDVDTSGWDNDVDWEPIEDDDKVEKSSSTGWDDFDTWDTIEDVKTTPQSSSTAASVVGGGGGWSTWGVSSLLSSATEGVSTFTSQVSQGLTTVLESSIGVPSPEELAKSQKLERAKLEEATPEVETKVSQSTSNDLNSGGGGSGGGGVFGLGNLLTGVTHITKLVETTSSKVVNTGLDTLETIGKKTMEVLQEGDPGLVKKRALLGLNPDKPCLSQVLREAKEKASVEDDEGPPTSGDAATAGNKRAPLKKVHFETLFDDYQGLVHLEALEMLSKQCDIKLCTILESMQDGSQELQDCQETMVQIKELCELPDDDDDDDQQQLQQLSELKLKLTEVVTELGLPAPSLTFTKLFECWAEAEPKMKSIDDDVNEIHRLGIDTLAKITSLAVEQFHKGAELLLIKERRSTADEADSLVQITTILTALIGVIAAKYSEKLDSLSSIIPDNPDLNALITNIFFEATQSSSYVQDAFQLFIPILQIGAV